MDPQYLLLAHLLGLALFLLAHGVSMFLVVALRRERNPDRLRALLDLSLMSVPVSYVGLLLIVASGIWLGFVGGYWGQGWIWTAIVVLVATIVFMGAMGSIYFGKLRVAVGLQPSRRTSQVTLGPVAPAAELDALLAKPQPGLTMIVGLLGLLILVWLMVLKPF